MKNTNTQTGYFNIITNGMVFEIEITYIIDNNQYISSDEITNKIESEIKDNKTSGILNFDGQEFKWKTLRSYKHEKLGG